MWKDRLSLRLGLGVAAFTALLASLTAGVLTYQVIAKGRHPFLTEATVGDLLPWMLTAFLASVPVALLAGAVASFLRRPGWSLLAAVLLLAVPFHFLRESASEFRIQASPLAEYPSQEQVKRSILDHAPKPEERPNLVLITIDTLRWDHLGFAGYERPVSPRLDDLARRGTVFRHGIAQAPVTSSSMASMMTGVSPHVLEHERAARGEGAFVAEGFHLLAERLTAAGYETGAFISNPYLKAANGYGQGFSKYDDETGLYKLDGPGRLINATQIVDAAIDWVTQRTSRAPFFLWTHILDPHHPYEPAEPGPWEDIESETFKAFAERYYAYSGNEMTEHFEALARGDVELEEGELDYLIGRYDAEILQSDREIGRLLDHLETLGATLENTVVLVTADHGEEFFDHGGLLHSHTLYDELIRVPFLVAGPGFEAGVEIDGQARLLDVAPTFLAAAKLPTEGLDGEALQLASDHDRPALSFLSLAEVSLRTPEKKLFANYRTYRGFACRRGNPFADTRQLFIARYGRGFGDQRPPARLFDLGQDPAEATPLADIEGIHDKQCLLAQQLEANPLRQIEDIGGAEGLAPEDLEQLRGLGYLE